MREFDIEEAWAYAKEHGGYAWTLLAEVLERDPFGHAAESADAARLYEAYDAAYDGDELDKFVQAYADQTQGHMGEEVRELISRAMDPHTLLAAALGLPRR